MLTRSLWLALALFGKEEIGLTVAMVGLAGALIFKRVRFGLTWIGIGLAYSLAALFIVIPLFRGEPSDTLLHRIKASNSNIFDISVVPLGAPAASYQLAKSQSTW